MKYLTRLGIIGGVVLLFVAGAPLVLAQGGKGQGSPIDLSGTWTKIGQEDTHERGSGPDPGEYWGLPLNDAARMRGDTYNEEWVSTSYILQCRPHPTGYQVLGPDPMRIEQLQDPINRRLIAYRVSYDETPGDRMVWLDGRPHPSLLAMHSWEGFSTGKFKGDTLIIDSTHMKEAFHRRNGVPSSFRATTIEHVSLDEPYLTWVVTTYDDDYLTEPVVRSATYIRAPTVQIPPYPCAAQQEEIGADADAYRVPNYFMGENPYLTEVAMKYKVPLEGVRGGAETTYPEWHAKGMALKPPTAASTLKPVYTDASTKIAERAAAQPKRAPSYDKLEALHAAGNVYVIAGAGGNIAASIGGDGVLLVDSGAEPAADKVLAAIDDLNKQIRPPERPDAASPFGDTWQATHAFAPTSVRTIINTSALPDHVGGNAKIRNSKEFNPLGVLGEEEQGSEVILAQEAAAKRMGEMGLPDDGIPTNTYFSLHYNMHRFFNNQAVQVTHMANAISDGDSIVFFRKSDVIATGDLYIADQYPPIDVDKGGSIDGEITALNKVFEMCVTEFMSQGGTVIIPGHGFLSDAADLGYYRDMLTVVRERVQKMVDGKMTLAQVLAAKPTMDYDPEYGREPGVTAKFVEAVYKSIATKKGK
jgi:glyoxylase-like metal-dependent hydrolase (beta-lactamase superfamily II)